MTSIIITAAIIAAIVTLTLWLIVRVGNGPDYLNDDDWWRGM